MSHSALRPALQAATYAIGPRSRVPEAKPLPKVGKAFHQTSANWTIPRLCHDEHVGFRGKPHRTYNAHHACSSEPTANTASMNSSLRDNGQWDSNPLDDFRRSSETRVTGRVTACRSECNVPAMLIGISATFSAYTGELGRVFYSQVAAGPRQRARGGQGSDGQPRVRHVAAGREKQRSGERPVIERRYSRRQSTRGSESAACIRTHAWASAVRVSKGPGGMISPPLAHRRRCIASDPKSDGVALNAIGSELAVHLPIAAKEVHRRVPSPR